MAKVYWIHLPEHTDMFSEGYVGVTERGINERMAENAYSAKAERVSCSELYSTFRERGRESLVVEVLVIAEVDYAFSIEEKLRPSPNIGWNIAAGGCRSGKGRNKPKTESQKEYMRNLLTGTTRSERTREKMSESQILWNKENPRKVGVSNGANPRVWGKADEIFTMYHLGHTQREICEKLSFEKLSNITQIWKQLKEGWNPMNDSSWTDRYKDAQSCLTNLHD